MRYRAKRCPRMQCCDAAIVREGGGDDGVARVRDRIEAALLQLDEATIATIHGFCHRALREFGFRAGQLADADAWSTTRARCGSEVAAELWRAAANAPCSPMSTRGIHGLTRNAVGHARRDGV